MRRRLFFILIFGVLLAPSVASAATLTLEWDTDPNPSITGYVISFGPAPGTYTGTVSTGRVTRATITVPSGLLHIAVQARSSSGLSAYSNVVTLVVDPPPAPTPLSGDFSGDGRFDLIWQNHANGQISSWFMNGINLVFGIMLTPSSVADTNWKIAARADMNRDGWPDLVWQHQTSGLISTWLMSGTRMMAGILLTPDRVADVNWKIVGAGDFNGDGHSDLVWHHQLSGMVSVWIMNGTALTAGVVLTPATVADLNWKVAGVGDLNYDGRPDLVWQHQVSGMVSTWLMSGTRMLEGRLLTPSIVADTNWKIRAIGDVNSDGRDDLVWQHQGQGWVSTWIMSGTSMASGVYLNPNQVTDLNWKIAGPR
jgi:hypothetical protein